MQILVKLTKVVLQVQRANALAKQRHVVPAARKAGLVSYVPAEHGLGIYLHRHGKVGDHALVFIRDLYSLAVRDLHQAIKPLVSKVIDTRRGKP